MITTGDTDESYPFRHFCNSYDSSLNNPFSGATLSRFDEGHGYARKRTSKDAGQVALKPAEGASVKILAPTKGQIFKGDQVPIQFKLVKGKAGHHVHAYVDNELMGMFEGEKGTLNGIKPGSHVLKLRVVADDHKTELDASDEVSFTVK